MLIGGRCAPGPEVASRRQTTMAVADRERAHALNQATTRGASSALARATTHMRLILYRHRVAALAGERVYYAPHRVLEPDHPERRFVAALCLYGHAVIPGGPVAASTTRTTRSASREHCSCPRTSTPATGCPTPTSPNASSHRLTRFDSAAASAPVDARSHRGPTTPGREERARTGAARPSQATSIPRRRRTRRITSSLALALVATLIAMATAHAAGTRAGATRAAKRHDRLRQARRHRLARSTSNCSARSPGARAGSASSSQRRSVHRDADRDLLDASMDLSPAEHRHGLWRVTNARVSVRGVRAPAASSPSWGR